MKPSAIITPIATLLLGIAIGWFAKPASQPWASAPLAGTTAPSPGHPQTAAKEFAQERPSKIIRPSLSHDSGSDSAEGADSEEADSRGQEMIDQMRKSAIDRFRKKLERHLAALDENLSLTPAQKAQLEAAIEAQLAEITQIMNGDGMNTKEALTKLPSLGTAPLESTLTASLSPEQKTALETYKSRELARQADTKALKKLALLQGVFELKEDQRDEVYRILTESSANSLAKVDPAAAFNDVFVMANGIDMDPYDLGVQQLMMEAAQNQIASDGEVDGDNKAMMETFRQKIDQMIEDRVNELKPVLDAAQLERYREELRTKGLGPYAGLLNRAQPGE